MKSLLPFLMLLLSFTAYPQGKTAKAKALQGVRSNENITDPKTLALHLTAAYSKDMDKVKAIFDWITDNIAYKIKPAQSKHNYVADTWLNDEADTAALKPLNERIAIETLNKRIAFCDGYARLFKTLCDYAGIRCEIISGYANGTGRNRNFISNHRWNAVFIDAAWHLLDATWGSGVVTYYSNEFVKQYNAHYFLTPPAAFAADHFPEELQWTLMAEPPVINEFRKSPFKTQAYFKNHLVSYSPQQGIIAAAPGDTLLFEIVKEGTLKPLYVCDSSMVDSTVISNTIQADTTLQNAFIKDGKSFCRYVVKSTDGAWLSLLYNDAVIIRYRLQARRNVAFKQ